MHRVPTELWTGQCRCDADHERSPFGGHTQKSNDTRRSGALIVIQVRSTMGEAKYEEIRSEAKRVSGLPGLLPAGGLRLMLRYSAKNIDFDCCLLGDDFNIEPQQTPFSSCHLAGGLDFRSFLHQTHWASLPDTASHRSCRSC